MSGLADIKNSSSVTFNQFLMCNNHLEGVFVWTSISVVSFIFGFPAAVAVLCDFLQRGRKGDQLTPYDVFVFNATVLDGIFLLFNLIEVYNFLHGHSWDFEVFAGFLFPFNLCGRPLFITCICVDCYLAVVHPVVYHANKSLTPRILTAAGVWTLTLIYGGIFVRYSQLINSFVQVLFFALTLPVIGFCDVTILWTLRRSNPAGGAVHPKKKKAQQVIISNLVITFTSYLPPVIGALLSTFLIMSKTTLDCLIMLAVVSSMLVGNTVLPILYLNSLGKLDWFKWFCQK